MKKQLQDRYDEIQDMLDGVVGDRSFTRAEAIEFCEELESWLDTTKSAMQEDEKREQESAGA